MVKQSSRCSHIASVLFHLHWVPVRYRGIHANVIMYIFAHLHMAFHTEGNMLDMN